MCTKVKLVLALKNLLQRVCEFLQSQTTVLKLVNKGFNNEASMFLSISSPLHREHTGFVGLESFINAVTTAKGNSHGISSFVLFYVHLGCSCRECACVLGVSHNSSYNFFL